MPRTATKFMPAPWHIEGQFDAEVSVEIKASDGRLVAEIEPFVENWTDAEVANVHLIAAAPELYEALRSLTTEAIIAPGKRTGVLLGKAETALAKARGER